MDIQECKENFEELKKNNFIIESIDKDFFLKFGETILSELDKKDTIIDLMAEQLTTPVHNKNWVIDYFTNKVEEDIKE